MMNLIIQGALKAMYALARTVAGAYLPRLIALILDAQQQFGKGTGTDKKAWVVARLQEEWTFAQSHLSTLPPVVLSMLVDALVAWTKTTQIAK